MIPKTFEQWKYQLINHCKVDLTKDFAQKRLSIYEDPANPETREFVAVYGTDHLQNILKWFRQI